MAAVKREKPEPLVDDVALCVQMGWTLEELQGQPARFVERLQIYLGTVADRQSREHERIEEELDRLKEMRR